MLERIGFHLMVLLLRLLCLFVLIAFIFIYICTFLIMAGYLI